VRRVLHDYSFAFVVGSFFVASLVAQLVFQVAHVTSELASHGQLFSWRDFWPAFGTSVTENWQSEFLQLLVQVVALRYTLYVGSSQSRDSDERLEAKVDRVLEVLER
jgi:hypothetical protein